MNKKLKATIYFRQARIMTFLLGLFLIGGQLAAQQAPIVTITSTETFDNYGFIATDYFVLNQPTNTGLEFLSNIDFVYNTTSDGQMANIPGECIITTNSDRVGHGNVGQYPHPDHTTGSGFYLFAVSPAVGLVEPIDRTIYYTSISVRKGETITFGVWIKNIDTGYNMRIDVVGSTLGTETSGMFSANNSDWNYYSLTVTATATENITFKVIDMYGYYDAQHKFGLDDISVAITKRALNITTPTSLVTRTTVGSSVPLLAEYNQPSQAAVYRWEKSEDGAVWSTVSGTQTTIAADSFTTTTYSATESAEKEVYYRLGVSYDSFTTTAFYSDVITIEFRSATSEYIFREDFGGNWVSNGVTPSTNASGDWWIMPMNEPSITSDFTYQSTGNDASNYDCLLEMYGQEPLKSPEEGKYIISKLVGGTKNSTLTNCGGGGNWDYGVSPDNFTSFPSMDDHTSEGDASKGYFMWAQSIGNDYKTVYSATIPVTPAMKGHAYVFGAYFMPSWGRNDGANDQLKMEVIGGSEINKSNIFKSTGTERVWGDEEQLIFMIPSNYSGADITISIQVKYGGFRFGLDDISVRKYDTFANITSPQTGSETNLSVDFTVDYQWVSSTIEYKWQKSASGIGGWTDITEAGATGTATSFNGTFTTNICAVEDGYYYRVLITDGDDPDYNTADNYKASGSIRLNRGNYIFKEDFGGITQSTNTSGDWWIARGDDAHAAYLKALYSSDYQYAPDAAWLAADGPPYPYGMDKSLFLHEDRFAITKISGEMYDVYYDNGDPVSFKIPNERALYDHTTENGTGYYMMSRGWIADKVLYSYTQNCIPAGNYSFNVWLAGTSTNTNTKTNLTLKIEVGSNEFYEDIEIGIENWTEYSVPFTTDGSPVKISIISGANHVGYATFGVDDISITDLRPRITYPDASEVSIIKGESITLEGEYSEVTSLGATITYQWEMSTNESGPWTAVYTSSPIANDNSVAITPYPTGPITSTVYYRLQIVGADNVTTFESASVKITPADWPTSKTYWVCPDNMLDDEHNNYLPSLIQMELPDLYVQYKWYDTDGVTPLPDIDKYKDGQTATNPIPAEFESDGKSNTMSVLNELSVNSGGVFTDREYLVEVLDKATGLPYPGREEKISVYVSRSYICASDIPIVSSSNSGLLHRENFEGTDPGDSKVAQNPPSGITIDYTQYTVDDDELPEGNYMLTKESPTLKGSGWTSMTDHVYDYDNDKHGYLFVVNADENPGRLYTHQMTDLGDCRDIELVFSGWFSSPVNWAGREKANLKFVITDTNTGNVLSEFITGNLTDRENIWRQYGFKFFVPEGVTGITLEVINNNFGTAGGNDVVIDDIEIYLAIPPVTLVPSGDSFVCPDYTSISLKGEYEDDGTLGDELDYRWEFKAKDTNTWEVITDGSGNVIGGSVSNGIVTPTQSEYYIANFTVAHDGDYRLVVGQKGCFGSDFTDTPNYDCVATSESRNLTLITSTGELPEPSLSGPTAFCYDDADTDGYVKIENDEQNSDVIEYYRYIWQLTGPNGTNSTILERSPVGNNTPVTEIKLKLADYTPGFYVITLMVFNKAECSYYSTHEFLIYPEVTTWTAKGNVRNWNDRNNWDNGVPGKCTDVIIPNKAMDITSGVELLGHYPLLIIPTVETLNESVSTEVGKTPYEFNQSNLNKQRSGKNDSDFSLRPACDNIWFKMGGTVVRTDYLNYISAKVDLDLKPDRWYTIAAPLRSMYSGDYYVDGNMKRRNPIVYMMKYNSTNPQTGDTPAMNTGDFSNPFNTLTEGLYPGLGFAVWVDDEKETSKADLQPFRFPRTEEQYEMWNYYGDSMGLTSKLDRSNIGRFTYEQHVTMNGNIPVAGTTDFDVTIKNDNTTYTTILVGNPFMAYLDFTAFATRNGISGGYYVWTTGNTYTALNPGDFSTDPNAIAPMQSFIVQKSGTVNNLTFTFDMAIAAPSNGNTLRSLSHNAVLQMDVLRDSEIHSHIRLKYDESESNSYDARKDMWTLFSEDITFPAVLYALIDGKAASIRTIGDLSEPIELGIRTTTKGLLTLRMMGMETLDTKYDLYLEDKLTGVTQSLRENPEYTFDNQTGNVQGRFFLKTDNSSGGGIIQPSDSDIRIFTENRQINVNSPSDDPIETIKIYSLHGNTLACRRSVNQSSFTMDSPVYSQVMIVSVKTHTRQKTEQLIIQ